MSLYCKMLCCNNCCRSFKTQWELQRHNSRKTACRQVRTTGTNTSDDEPPFPPLAKNASPECCTEVPENACKWCMKIISTKKYLHLHMQKCKHINDPIRELEIEAGVHFVHRERICRFCNVEFSQTCHLNRHLKTCKNRESHRLKLVEVLRRRRETAGGNTTINNNSFNNMIINNHLHINCLGKEDLSYLTCEVIQQLWKGARTDEEAVARTMQYIHAHKDHPENHNIVYSNLRSNSALVKMDDQFEYMNIDDILRSATSNWLDKCILSGRYDGLSKEIMLKYEKACEHDEMNKKANNLTKIHLYNSYKSGSVQRPELPRPT